MHIKHIYNTWNKGKLKSSLLRLSPGELCLCPEGIPPGVGGQSWRGSTVPSAKLVCHRLKKAADVPVILLAALQCYRGYVTL